MSGKKHSMRLHIASNNRRSVLQDECLSPWTVMEALLQKVDAVQQQAWRIKRSLTWCSIKGFMGCGVLGPMLLCSRIGGAEDHGAQG